ncbi:MAG: hypothetical protein HY042_12700 [Spirochaetia bacterium]|nr:hypothetical protein [Spirochaetia bacterium]
MRSATVIFSLIAIGAGAACIRMPATFSREVQALGLAGAPAARPAITENDLLSLPAPAQRYLRFMGGVGQERDVSFRSHFRGRFRSSADAPWKDLDALQFTNGPHDIARLFYMVLPFYGVPVLGRDTYAHGKGRLLVRVLDSVTVQDGQGMEFDLGELVTWLNDAVLLCPSMLLTPSVTWQAVDTNSFEVALSDKGNTVTARVLVDERGAVQDFRTNDRWMAPPGQEPKRTMWSTPVTGWTRMNGRMLPAQGQAVWKLPDGDLPYAEFRIQPGDIVFNAAPGSLP